MSHSNTHIPRVSVLMPTYNKAGMIGETIRSILEQTFTDFEFLICDDGSPDNTLEVLRSFDDPRIRILENKTNMGIGHTRNRLLSEAYGEFIAFTDHDDISLPERFDTQIRYMDEHPDCDIISCVVELIDVNGNLTGEIWNNTYSTHEEILVRGVYQCAMAQPASMIRRKSFIDAGIQYSPDYKYADDMYMYCQAFDKLSFYNLQTPLYRYRFFDECTSLSNREAQIEEAIDTLIITHQKLGVNVKSTDRNILRAMHVMGIPKKLLPSFRKYVYKIVKANKKAKKYDPEILKEHMKFLYMRCEKPITRKDLSLYIPYLIFLAKLKIYS